MKNKITNAFLVLCLVANSVVSASSRRAIEPQRSLSRASSAPARLVTPPEIAIYNLNGDRINGIGAGVVKHKGLEFTIPPQKLDEMRDTDDTVICLNLIPNGFDYFGHPYYPFLTLKEVVRSGEGSRNWNAVFENTQKNMNPLLCLALAELMGDERMILGNSAIDLATDKGFRHVFDYINWLNQNPDMIRHGGREGAMYLVLYAFLSKDLKHNPEYNPLRNALREYFEGKPLFSNRAVKVNLGGKMHKSDIDILRNEGFDVTDHGPQQPLSR